jgi:hypothetical protein
MSTKSPSAIITVSSGKAAEIKGFPGVFSCLLEHEVTKTKATFDWTGPKISPKVWAQVMEFFEWTYQTEKSESQVRLFVHPEHGWAAWAFPQEGGTGMTSREEPMTCDASTEQRKQFSDTLGWLYWGTVHHHCSAGAFASGTDDANEKDQEGIHITIGHMDKAVRDFHCRMYVKGHKFEPMMHHFWQLPTTLLDKADEMADLFGIYPDLNKAARNQMCQNSTKLYQMDAPDWKEVEGYVFFPKAWMDNYKVRRWQSHSTQGQSWQVNGRGGGVNKALVLGGEHWCHTCEAWGDHVTNNCTGRKLSKKEKRKLKYIEQSKLKLIGDGKVDPKPNLLLDDLSAQALLMGFDDLEFSKLLELLASGNTGTLVEIIMESAKKENVKLDDLLLANLEAEIKSEMEEKKTVESAQQEQQIQINGQQQQGMGWDGHYGY